MSIWFRVALSAALFVLVVLLVLFLFGPEAPQQYFPPNVWWYT